VIDALLEHREFVRSLAWRFTFSPSAAEDLEQETWLTALERPPESPIFSPRGWLAQVVRSLAVSRLRKERRRLVRETRARRVGSEPSPSELFDRDRVRERLLIAMEQLGPLERQVIELHYAVGLSAREIARQLEMSPRRVRGICERACERLRLFVEAG